MCISKNDTVITFDLALIIRAIDKAISADVPNQLREHHMETCNYIGQMRGDFINDNLRTFALTNGYSLLPFQRYGWHGRLLVNHDKHITLSIVTQENLLTIPRKKRSRPHYSMSILKMQNSDLKGQYVQQTLFPMESFDNDLLRADYETIMAGSVEPSEGYHHYFVAYRADSNELVDIKLVLMDPLFNIVEEHSLNHLIKPDFSLLTDTLQTNPSPSTEESHNKATRQLLKLKAGVKAN